MKRLMCLLPLLLSTLAFNATAEETMRCGADLVTPGATKLDVLEKCGPPALQEVISGANETKVEQWVYKTDDTAFPRILTFVGLRLTRIELLLRR